MRRLSVQRLVTFLLAGALLHPAATRAQVLKKLKKTAARAATRQTQAEVDRLIRNAIRCAVDDPACYQRAKASKKDVVFVDDEGQVITDDKGAPITDPDAARQAAPPAAPGEGVWANYDFVAGDDILFYDDYSGDNVGDFPRHLTLVRGNWDVVEWQGRRLLRNLGPRSSAIEVPLPSTLPDRFTIEFEAYLSHPNHTFVVATAPPARKGGNVTQLEGNYFKIGSAQRTGVDARRGGVQATNKVPELSEGLVPIRIMVDGQYAKVYAGSRRVANVPNAELAHTQMLYIENTYSASEKNPIYIGPIRVAGGGADLYDVLAEKGRVATHGIYFAVNSERIRPESTPTLKEIAGMLRDHADLRIRIEGHTDSDGEEAYNQQLSERRAAAVKQYLVDTAGIAGSRLETVGFGESKPVAENDTPEGKQKNRRVELVRLEGD